MKFSEDFKIRWVTFGQLSPHEVHDLLKLRQDIFVVEQASLYADIDGKDPDALHCLVTRRETGALVGAIRVFADEQNGEARIGRVVIADTARGSGLGRAMMLEGIAKVERLVPGANIVIGAQAHLEQFYQSLGFETTSAPYDEDGILHIDMNRVG